MGQGQSQSQGHTLNDEGKVVLENRPETPESERVDPEERARLQAEDRARRAAAAEQRLNAKKKTGVVPSSLPKKKKKESALEELSRENRGYRVADENADLRAYN